MKLFVGLILVLCYLDAVPTVLMSLLVLNPIAKSKETDPIQQKKLFWKYFWIRFVILLILSCFTVFTILVLDIIVCIIMAIFVVPKLKNQNNVATTTQPTVSNTIAVSQPQNLNESINNQHVVVNESPQQTMVPVLPTSFDSMYHYEEEKMLEVFINKELQKAKINKYLGFVPRDILKRRKIMSILKAFLVFVFVSMIFFHFPLYSYIIGLIILLIIIKSSKKFDLAMYLKKEMKARPSEKISNIIMNTKQNLTKDDSIKVFKIGCIVAIVLSLLIFIKPRIIYEKMDNGYGVRFYTFGLTNFTSANIPETYKGEKVVSLRGNTFSNMFFLKNITLPDSITEIRGQAFKNLYFLEEINLPSKLEYLGGGAFYNCKRLKSIVIPDSVTELGGESFYNAVSLESVKLSVNITEIRGNTFENCSSLKSITIPDKVTRIGGHAFYGNSSLSEVKISPYSQLKEIGSSAFRLCNNLYNITLPRGVYVNDRAFKESPTKIDNYFSFSTIENDTYIERENVLELNKETYFAEFNLTLNLESYIYSVDGVTTGTINIDFNNSSNDIKFNFNTSNATSFTYLNYNIKIKMLLKNKISVMVRKDTSYYN